MTVANQSVAVNNTTGAGVECVAADGSLTTKPLSSLRTILTTMEKHPTCCSVHLPEMKNIIIMELTTLIMDPEIV